MKNVIKGLIIAVAMAWLSSSTLLAQSATYTGCVWYYCITFVDQYISCSGSYFDQFVYWMLGIDANVIAILCG